MPPTRRFNERPSPPVKNRTVQLLQILQRLRRYHGAAVTVVLDDLGLTDDDLTECLEHLYQQAIEDDALVECGCCDGYHRPDFNGDCRNGDEHFPGW